MIVTADRARLGETLARFLNGELSIERFCNQPPMWRNSNDPGVDAIVERWFDLNDLDLLSLWRSSKDLDAGARQEMERCRLFLRTNLPYEWPLSPNYHKDSWPSDLAGFGLPLAKCRCGSCCSTRCSLRRACCSRRHPQPLLFLKDVVNLCGASVIGARAIGKLQKRRLAKLRALGKPATAMAEKVAISSTRKPRTLRPDRFAARLRLHQPIIESRTLRDLFADKGRSSP